MFRKKRTKKANEKCLEKTHVASVNCSTNRNNKVSDSSILRGQRSPPESALLNNNRDFAQEANFKREVLLSRESSPSPTTTMSTFVNRTKVSRMQGATADSISLICKEWRDLSLTTRLHYYSKYQELVDLADIWECFTASDLQVKAEDYEIKINGRTPSINVIRKLLKDLETDSCLCCKIVRTGFLKPAYVYYCFSCTEDRLARYCHTYDETEAIYQERKKKRVSPEELKDIWKKQSDIGEELRAEKKGAKFQQLQEDTKEISLAQSRGNADARKIRDEEEKQEQEAYITKRKQQEDRRKNQRGQNDESNLQDPSPGDSFNVLLYNRVQELTMEELEHDLQSKPFRAEYNKMLQQIGGMTKEEFDSILRLEELKRKRDRG